LESFYSKIKGVITVSFCTYCGGDKGEGQFCSSCGRTESQKAPTMAAPNSETWAATSPAQNQSSSSLGGIQSSTHSVKPSLGGAVTLLVFGLVGAVSPFLPYVSAGGESASGWESKKYLAEEELFSAGPIIVLLCSIVAAVIAGVIISNLKAGKSTPKAGVGVACLVSGAAAAISTGATYNALDELFREAEIAVDQGLGLTLGAICGAAIVVLGIVILVKDSVTQGNK